MLQHDEDVPGRVGKRLGDVAVHVPVYRQPQGKRVTKKRLPVTVIHTIRRTWLSVGTWLMSLRVVRKGPEAVGEDGYLADADDAHGRQLDGVHEQHRKRKRIAFATCTNRSVPMSTRKVIIGLVRRASG